LRFGRPDYKYNVVQDFAGLVLTGKFVLDCLKDFYDVVDAAIGWLAHGLAQRQLVANRVVRAGDHAHHDCDHDLSRPPSGASRHGLARHTGALFRFLGYGWHGQVTKEWVSIHRSTTPSAKPWKTRTAFRRTAKPCSEKAELNALKAK
jgi:hypothetical protein